MWFLLIAGCFYFVGHLRVSSRFDAGVWNALYNLPVWVFFLKVNDNAIYLCAYRLQLMAEERSLTVDMVGFNIAMDEAREKSRNACNKVAYYFFLSFSSFLVVFVTVIADYFIVLNCCIILGQCAFNYIMFILSGLVLVMIIHSYRCSLWSLNWFDFFVYLMFDHDNLCLWYMPVHGRQSWFIVWLLQSVAIWTWQGSNLIYI